MLGLSAVFFLFSVFLLYFLHFLYFSPLELWGCWLSGSGPRFEFKSPLGAVFVSLHKKCIICPTVFPTLPSPPPLLRGHAWTYAVDWIEKTRRTISARVVYGRRLRVMCLSVVFCQRRTEAYNRFVQRRSIKWEDPANRNDITSRGNAIISN